VALLALSGSLLIVAEPERSLTNPVFGVKLALLTAALIATCVLQRGFQENADFWDRTSALQRTGRAVAAVSLLLWSGVVLAGRLIAYLGPT
jgi:hypothetical protein